jgi:hypothetical protein
MPSTNFPTTCYQQDGHCWSDEEDGSDSSDSECEEGHLAEVPSATPGIWFSCPICRFRMTQVNMCLFCEVCLATTNHLVWITLFELVEYYNTNRH